ncbi:5-hydroxytryptamine receptor 5A [Misgurnus anguillicaudatus]|uniref:5-hydroxytryptamine receptor 5A n=1 Tax=Misgurnus anguillicaudatus TaxID=75329 RepID=UPI003CCF96CC
MNKCYEFETQSSVENSTDFLSSHARLMLETLMVIMSLGAVTGNVLVIVIVAATKTFHTVTSVLIINLAISDLLVGVGVMPFVAVSIMNNGWVSCNDLCLFVGYTSSVYCTVSVLTLAAIALDRYFSIMDCLRYNSRCTIWTTGSAVLWIWLQAMVTSCPPLFGWSDVVYVAPMYSCAVNWANSPSYTVFMSVLCFLLPGAIILYCYVKIVRVARYHARRIHSLEEHFRTKPTSASVSDLQRSSADVDVFAPTKLVYYVSGRFVADVQLEVPGEATSGDISSTQSGGRLHSILAQLHSSSPQHPNQPQHHGILRLFLVIATFFLCWTPYICVSLVRATETALSWRTSFVPPSAVTFSYWLLLFNSDINPLLYALLSKRFQGALQGLRCRIQARLGGAVELAGAERSTGGGGADSDPTNSSRNDSAPLESTYSPVCTLSSSFPKNLEEEIRNVLPSGSVTTARSVCRKCSGNNVKTSDHLQVPSRQCERNRLPDSAATKKKQATFFYGEITVRVEHDVC